MNHLPVKPEILPWSENLIAATLARQIFHRKHLVVVPNCSWPGSECDLLVVTPSLRIIDVEIKISRADLLADTKKRSGITVGTFGRMAATTLPKESRASGRTACGSTITACRKTYGMPHC